MALADLRRIATFYSETAGPDVSENARAFLQKAIGRLVTDPVTHRPGKRGTRECMLTKYPYVLIYRTTAHTVRLVRILHQARDYFSR
ncbi:MAG: type II toxin-antitoxin system RelE/ParE family toxin [Betaproteobacteria bacterium]|nr:type II toxin-antitoxin system RelE/ParE family toxin [Betaproteobacteria bacterium]